MTPAALGALLDTIAERFPNATTQPSSDKGPKEREWLSLTGKKFMRCPAGEDREETAERYLNERKGTATASQDTSAPSHTLEPGDAL